MEGPPSLSKITSNTTYMGITTESIYKQRVSLLTTGLARSQLRQSTAPPKHVIKADQFLSFYATLAHRFLVGGDYNAKLLTNYSQRTGIVQRHADGQPSPCFHRRANLLAQRQMESAQSY
jgi:hypothetical protein